MIIASLIQSEGHPEDFDKVARVIYNRLDEATWGGTYGYLQMDATVNYALGKSDINLTTEELQNTDSPFNTYLNPGLPPTPINSPGEAAMEAALNPADGRLAVLRDGQPGHRRDQVHRGLQRVPGIQVGAVGVARREPPVTGVPATPRTPGTPTSGTPPLRQTLPERSDPPVRTWRV